jgi:hypothetical protein
VIPTLFSPPIGLAGKKLQKSVPHTLRYSSGDIIIESMWFWEAEESENKDFNWNDNINRQK